jgi:hypothetical protein
LSRRQVLADLFRGPMKVSNVRRYLRHDFAVGSQHQSQHTMCAWVLWTHVDEHFVRSDVEFDDLVTVELR